MPNDRPIQERIAAALEAGITEYYGVAHAVFPQERYPRAWRCCSHGGPPGCFMALSAALRRGGYVWFTDKYGNRIISRRKHNAE